MGSEIPPNARDLALRRLTVREYSSVEMKGYLRRKGVSDDEAQAVVRELEEQGLIEQRRRGIRADLHSARKLYETEAVGAGAGGGEFPPEVDAIKKVLSSRFPEADLSDRKVVARVYRALLRRGFSPSAVRSTLDLID